MRTFIFVTLVLQVLTTLSYASDRELLIDNRETNTSTTFRCSQTASPYVKVVASNYVKKIFLNHEDCVKLAKSLSGPHEMQFKIIYSCIKGKGCFTNRVIDFNESVFVSVQGNISWAFTKSQWHQDLFLVSENYDSDAPDLNLKCADRQSYLSLPWPTSRRILMPLDRCQKLMEDLLANPQGQKLIKFTCEDARTCHVRDN